MNIKAIEQHYEQDFIKEVKTIDDIYASLSDKSINKKYDDISITFSPYSVQNQDERRMLETHKDNIRAFQFFVKISDIMNLVDEFMQKRGNYKSLFDENIRGYLGLSASQFANRAMNKVLNDKAERSYFGIYNNGITVISPNIEIIKTGGLKLKATNPSIINGLQTTMTIYNTIKKANIDDFTNTEVLIKLYEVKGSDLPHNIVISSNTQAKITIGNKLSNLLFIKQLESYFTNQSDRVKLIRKIDDIDENIDNILIEDALHFWYATYYNKPHLATSRRVNIVTQFHRAFVEKGENKESHDLRSVVNRKDGEFLKEVFCACKIYLQLQKQQDYIKIPNYMFEMIGFIVSKTSSIDYIYTNKTISESIIKLAKDKVEKILKDKTEKEKSNFIRTKPAFESIARILSPNSTNN